jgi:hypothetical protein
MGLRFDSGVIAMARTESMAAIDAALQNPQNIKGTATTGNASVVAPHVAPGVQTPTPITSQGKLTADEKRYIDAQRQAQSDIDRQAESDVQQQQERESAFDRSANATVNAAGGILRGTGLTLASLPTPGDLILPLGILLVFFFLLLPVNGHTRLVWIWLVLTGNAEIQQGGSSSSSSSSNGAGDFSAGAGGSFAPSSTGASPINSNGSSDTSSNPIITPLVPIASTLVNIGSWVEDIL